MKVRAFLLLFLSMLSFQDHARAATEIENTCSGAKIISPFDQNFLRNFTPLRPNPGPITKYSAVYGRDNRKLMKTEYPWRAIGALLLNNEINCTATLIDSCYVLTAAHCVSNSDGSAKAIDSLSFQGSNHGPKAQAKDFIFGRYDLDATWDWAIVKLDKNLGDQLGYLGVQNTSGTDVDISLSYNVAGYSADVGNNGKEATVDDEVKVRYHHNSSTNFIYHNANSYKGSSGAAIFYFNEKNEPWIVGVNTRATLNADGRQLYFKK